MNIPIFQQLSEGNPQLSREIKGRFIPRNILLVVAISGIIQFSLVMCFYNKLVKSYMAENWQWWWYIIFQCLIWGVAVVLVVGGTYTLVGDLAKEKSSGTLNFIRLSPQSSQSILIGKILGVPSLIYLGILLAIPLYIVAAINSSTSLLWIVSYISFVGISCFLLYSIALLYSLIIGNHAWFVSFLSSCLLCGTLKIYLRGSRATWFSLDFDNESFIFSGFILITLSLGSYWIWQAVNRRFRNPDATLLSKKQSYYLVAMVQVWFLGFLVATPAISKYSYEDMVPALVANLLLFATLAIALSPHFQACTDWARYRHSQNGNHLVKYSLIRDLIWAEKSPALLVIALNLALTGIIWITWILFWPSDSDKLLVIVSLVFCGNLILIYAAIAQLMLLMKTPKRFLWTIGTFIATLGLPPLILTILSSEATIAPVFWLTSVFGAPWLVLTEASTIGIFLAILSQWSIFGLLSTMLTRKLQKAGESNSKALLTGG